MASWHGGGMSVSYTHLDVYKRQIVEQVAARLFPGARIIDGNGGTAEQLARVLKRNDLQNDGPGPGMVELHSSGDESFFIPLMERLMKE